MANGVTARQDLYGHFLSQALDARRIIDELMELAQSEAQSSGSRETLQGVIDSLEMEPALRQTPKSRFVFSHYEQICTLDEVKKPEERAALTIELKKLLLEGISPRDWKNSLYDTIDFFADVEIRALYHYRRRPGAWASASV